MAVGLRNAAHLADASRNPAALLAVDRRSAEWNVNDVDATYICRAAVASRFFHHGISSSFFFLLIFSLAHSDLHRAFVLAFRPYQFFGRVASVVWRCTTGISYSGPETTADIQPHSSSLSYLLPTRIHCKKTSLTFDKPPPINHQYTCIIYLVVANHTAQLVD